MEAVRGQILKGMWAGAGQSPLLGEGKSRPLDEQDSVFFYLITKNDGTIKVYECHAIIKFFFKTF